MEDYQLLNETKICIQFSGNEEDCDTIIDRIKNHYFSEGNTVSIEKMQVYLKPEENSAYYVINNSVKGKVSMYK